MDSDVSHIQSDVARIRSRLDKPVDLNLQPGLPPTFSGSMGDDLTAFLYKIQLNTTNFRNTKLSSHDMIVYASSFLEGNALAWFLDLAHRNALQAVPACPRRTTSWPSSAPRAPSSAGRLTDSTTSLEGTGTSVSTLPRSGRTLSSRPIFRGSGPSARSPCRSWRRSTRRGARGGVPQLPPRACGAGADPHRVRGHPRRGLSDLR